MLKGARLTRGGMGLSGRREALEPDPEEGFLLIPERVQARQVMGVAYHEAAPAEGQVFRFRAATESMEPEDLPAAGGGAPSPHALGGEHHSEDTLANLNSKVSDATLDTSSAARTPAAHVLATTGPHTGALLLGDLADIATSRLLGRVTGGAGDPEVLTGTQATVLLDAFTSALKGLAPASGGGTDNFLRADGAWAAPAGGGKVSKSYLFEFPAEDMAVGDFIPENAIRIPAAGKHGGITWGTAYARCETVGVGTNTILFRTSTTLTGARTTRATINLGTAREASGAVTLTETDGMYLWVECSAVGGTAPKKVTVQVDCEEAVY